MTTETVKESWNGFAITGFVLSLTFTPLAFIFSPLALSQLKKDPNQRGKGLAQAGLIIAIIHASLVFLMLLVVGMGL
jgi:hypothetical protein